MPQDRKDNNQCNSQDNVRRISGNISYQDGSSGGSHANINFQYERQITSNTSGFVTGSGSVDNGRPNFNGASVGFRYKF